MPQKCFMVFRKCSSWTKLTNAQIQLWKFRSCSFCSFSSRSSSSPSMRRDKFPLFHHSADNGDFFVAESRQSVQQFGCAVQQVPRLPRGGNGLDPTVAHCSRVQTWRKRSRSHSCNVDAGHCCSHACRFATTGVGDVRDSAVFCGGSAVGAHRPAWFFWGRVHRCTVGLTPAIRAGKGWGRRELAPKCSTTQ